MLEDTKTTYLNCADSFVPNWRDMSKNELAFKAVENRNNKSYDGYVSALMVKYWNKMVAFYHRCKLVATPEDAHSWLVQAVMYALDKHPWTNPSSSIYQDKNGPDKVINRVIESRRKTFYQQLNRYNRKINSAILSIDSLSEEWADANTPYVEDEHMVDLDEMVIECFKIKDYFYAFLLDAIIYENYTLHKNTKKLVTHLLTLDDDHCETFSCRYGLDYDKVKRASSYITRMNRISLNERVAESQKELRKRFKLWGLFNVDRIA